MKEIPSKPISVCVPRLFIVFEILFREYILCPHTHTHTHRNWMVESRKKSFIITSRIYNNANNRLYIYHNRTWGHLRLNEWMDGCYSDEINGRNVSIFFLFAASPFNELYWTLSSFFFYVESSSSSSKWSLYGTMWIFSFFWVIFMM